MNKLLFLILVSVLFNPLSVKSEVVAKLANSKLEIIYHEVEHYLNNCDYHGKLGRPCRKWTFNFYPTNEYPDRAFGYCRRNNSDQECDWQQYGKDFKIKLHKGKGFGGAIKREIIGTINASSVKGQIYSKSRASFIGQIFPSGYLTLNTNKNENIKKTEDALEKEKQKIADEKKKIEEEKRKIAEAKKKQEEEERKKKEEKAKLYIIGSGTGFFVSAEGHIVSNDHVVGICRKVASEINGELKYFNVLKTDEVNDLGLIKGDYKSPSYLSIKSEGAEFGEDIVAFGYPLSDDLSDSVKLTRGIVSSLSGPGNNYSEIQIDAAIQKGNSGGPVMNMDGQVVGVASSGLSKLYILEKNEFIPENVNFAVASPTLSNFLKANGVSITNQKFNIKNTKELARIGRPSTLQLFCMNTKAVFEELKKKKKHSDVLFEKVIDIK